MKRPNILHQIYQNVSITNTVTFLFSVILILISLAYISCSNPLEPVDSEEEKRVKSALKDRSFRQFDPSKDAGKRKGVILDFFDSENKIITLWAQYAEGETALKEWEIFAKDYRVEKAGSEYRLYFTTPRSHQILPNECDDCIETAGISISIRNLFDSEKIQFKLNDADKILPSPFPVFKSWTRFNEDEYFD
ncbi:MAG: hypothetical protein OXI43_12960 [Candidatus Poribacteria bacterium]|nr:hypothetical protein [Candidatus Poribacteria bacterium]